MHIYLHRVLITFSLLAASVLLFPRELYAQTGGVGVTQTPEALIASLQEQIKILQEQIQALREGRPLPNATGSGTGRPIPNDETSAFAPGTAGSGFAVFTFDQYLRLGSRGDAVRQLQQALSSDAALYPEKLVTGYFGTLTEVAVKRFQAKYGIVSSGDPESTGYGAVGPRTNAKLREMFAGTRPSLPSPNLPPSENPFLRSSSPSSVPPANPFLQSTPAPSKDCAQESGQSSQDACWQIKAEKDTNVALCENIKTVSPFVSRDGCINLVAHAKKNAALCARIQNSDIKKNCEEGVIK